MSLVAIRARLNGGTWLNNLLIQNPRSPVSRWTNIGSIEASLTRPYLFQKIKLCKTPPKSMALPSKTPNLIVEKVMLVLATNSWYGRPEAEIRRASDWQGETQ